MPQRHPRQQGNYIEARRGRWRRSAGWALWISVTPRGYRPSLRPYIPVTKDLPTADMRACEAQGAQWSEGEAVAFAFDQIISPGSLATEGPRSGDRSS